MKKAIAMALAMTLGGVTFAGSLESMSESSKKDFGETVAIKSAGKQSAVADTKTAFEKAKATALSTLDKSAKTAGGVPAMKKEKKEYDLSYKHKGILGGIVVAEILALGTVAGIALLGGPIGAVAAGIVGFIAGAALVHQVLAPLTLKSDLLRPYFWTSVGLG